jgi:hypothetical protein
MPAKRKRKMSSKEPQGSLKQKSIGGKKGALKILQIMAGSTFDNFGQLDGSWLTFVWTSLRAS